MLQSNFQSHMTVSRRLISMLNCRQIIATLLLTASLSCSDPKREPQTSGQGELQTKTTVGINISPKVSSLRRNAVLSIIVREPSNYSKANPVRFSIGTICSVDSPDVTWSGLDGSSWERRLVAVREDGFEVRFTKILGLDIQTNNVLFHYGKTTETNALGINVVGKYK